MAEDLSKEDAGDMSRGSVANPIVSQSYPGTVMYVPLKGMPGSEGSSKKFARLRKGFVATRRGSTGAIPTTSFSNHSPLFSTPENRAYDDFSERKSSLLQGRRPERRSSLSKIDAEVMLRHSLASVNEYHDENENIQRLKERFERRGSLLTSSRSSQSHRSMIGSVVETSLSEDFHSCLQADIISDTTQSSTGGMDKESESMPLTEVHHSQKVRSNRRGAEREHLIECLVNFSAHISTSVLEDLVSHESKIVRDKRSYSDGDDNSISNGSLSSLSSGGNLSMSEPLEEAVEQKQSVSQELLLNRSSLPPSRERQSALLFVDITGFTKLSTVLDVESLSKVINSYFEMIVTEVILHGGDVLKFAGDAFFAEWRGSDEPYGDMEKLNPMQKFNASLSSSQGFKMSGNDQDDTSRRAIGKPISSRVWQAARCAASIVEKFSDFHVSVDSMYTGNSLSKGQALLDVHCGIGAGRVVGLHVRDFQDDTEDVHEDTAGVELRREFLVIGMLSSME
jgi:class 3 adenylate cyclase